MSDSGSEDTLDLLEEAGQLPEDEKNEDKPENADENEEGDGEDNKVDEGEEKTPSAKELRDQKVEDWLNRWTRAAGINEVAHLDGPKNNVTKLSLSRDKIGPVRDEIKAWMRMDRKPPAPITFDQYDSGEENFQHAIEACHGGLYIPEKGDDLKFYQRWAETLQFRWNYDMASLELRRSHRGWKWQLIRIRPNGTVIVEPFIKPLQRPNREWGKLSPEWERPRTSSSRILDNIRSQAEERFIGVPVTRTEELEDEREFFTMRVVEAVREHYGFVGEMICNAAAEMRSSIYVLLLLLGSLWALVFWLGPTALAPMLSEFVIGLLPLQSSLRGALAAAKELQMKDLEQDILDDLPKPAELGGNARQWLLYWPFYGLTSGLVSWIQIARPEWYHFATGCRTAVCVFMASPFCSSNVIHGPDRQAQRKRLMLRVWAARGQRLANEAILHEPPPSRMSSKNVAKGKSPLQGNKNLDPKSAIQQKLLTARMLCGFYEDYYKGSINTGQRPLRKLSSYAESLRKAIIETNKALAKLPQQGQLGSKERQVYNDKCQEMDEKLSKSINKLYVSVRTTDGSSAFQKFLRHRYGATDEQAAEFQSALAFELGVKAAQEDGSYKASDLGQVRSAWLTSSAQVFGNPGSEAFKAAKRDLSKPWDLDYRHQPYKVHMPDNTARHEAMLRGDASARAELNAPSFQQKWRSRLASLGVDPAKISSKGDPSWLPWEDRYKHREVEDMTNEWGNR